MNGAEVPRACLLRQVVLALTRQQRNEQKKLKLKAKYEASKALKKGKKDKKKGDRLSGEDRKRSTLITQMVDNILSEGFEVGYDSADDAGDLSGDEIKAPVFVIKQDGGPAEDMKVDDDDNQMDLLDEGGSDEEAADDFFVQEEYDLANNLD